MVPFASSYCRLFPLGLFASWKGFYWLWHPCVGTPVLCESSAVMEYVYLPAKAYTLHQELSELLLTPIQGYHGSKDRIQLWTTTSKWELMSLLRCKIYAIIAATNIGTVL